jgi:Flp pilus assembly pilin Flp
MRQRLARFWQDRRGASAVEFAIVVPLLGALTIGAINLCILVYMDARLQFAVDGAARCGAIGTCTATSQAASSFGFASLSPTFSVPVSANCHGTKVTGTVTYPLNAVLASFSIPLTASSCFAAQG